MPAGFALPTDFTEDAAEPAQLYVPRAPDPDELTDFGNHGDYGAARLAPGANVARATDELRAATRAAHGRGPLRRPRQPERVRGVAAGRDPGPEPARGRADRGGRAPAAADRVRQRGEPAAGARRLSPARAGAARRGRRRPRKARGASARRGAGAGAAGGGHRPAARRRDAQAARGHGDGQCPARRRGRDRPARARLRAGALRSHHARLRAGAGPAELAARRHGGAARGRAALGRGCVSPPLAAGGGGGAGGVRRAARGGRRPDGEDARGAHPHRRGLRAEGRADRSASRFRPAPTRPRSTRSASTARCSTRRARCPG